MAISVGGIRGSGGAGELRFRPLLDELQALAGPVDRDDYVVDLAVCPYRPQWPPEWLDWDGVKPGPVGRTQRRFIVWIAAPTDTPHNELDRRWIAEQLLLAADLVREHVPRRSKTFPVDRLADELMNLHAAVLQADARRPDA